MASKQLLKLLKKWRQKRGQNFFDATFFKSGKVVVFASAFSKKPKK